MSNYKCGNKCNEISQPQAFRASTGSIRAAFRAGINATREVMPMATRADTRLLLIQYF
ncbi:hypothetical protein [Oceanispirochaeta sp.]|uniref:hypothetical protein n=1 Tax=Oceanispirochaeta sp. TaxID=2035350 RepID=UPI00260390D4|nr:hypothetical protein [Oceanispirochaeta sp.]MDA3958177.1 hypothetical protein [Oceanispirochaeta sp.]